MNRKLRNFLATLAGGWVASLTTALGLALPLEIHLQETPFNYRDQRGVPVSFNVAPPPASEGSNGQLPLTTEPAGIFGSATPKQFTGLLTFGGIPGQTLTNWQAIATNTTLQAGATPFSGNLATQMGLPTATSGGTVLMVLRRAQIGAPYFSRAVSFSFGSVITPPLKDQNGILLAADTSTTYWRAEPYSANNHQDDNGFYWSPHARLVYAIQAGPIQVSWIKSVPYPVTDLPAYTNPNGPVSFLTNGANVFLVYTENYVASGSPVKTPRKMYWTQKGFQNLGVPVQIPTARVGAVNVVYNTAFPRTVSQEFSGVGDTSPTEGNGATALQELRTLWYEKQLGSLYAYNTEGRAFVELLGDLRADGQSYVQLGFEIVDVAKQALPIDTRVEIGERIVPPGDGSLATLYPREISSGSTVGFSFQHSTQGANAPELYATRETQNLNDYLVHWLEEGVAGLRWPKTFGRYQLVWPTDVSHYSHFVRPAVATQEEATKTAVQLSTANAPTIEYQDPLDRPRAKLTAEFKFYTFLDAQYPVHRTLLRYTAGDRVGFERVFSWLDSALRTTNFSGGQVSAPARIIAASLASWNPNEFRFDWPADFALTAPRVVNQTVDVAQRINPPPETDIADGSGYLAGHLNLDIGTSYDVSAYKDPLAAGFEAANKAAIIPVNVIPGRNQLEVWWFRTNSPSAGLNAGNQLLGFSTVYWPSVIGRYTIQWPADPREIVLASKLGGQHLSTSEALGIIYYENDPSKHGYNPNEEHAIMSGGTPFATRDDLNIVTSDPNSYSSDPYVLVEYSHPDGRPAMSAFKVLREKPSAGWVFDYPVPAGQKLQPPPPLAFLAKPVEGTGDAAINYNTEPLAASGDLPGGWDTSAANGKYGHYNHFTYKDRKNDFWVYRGLHTGLPALEIGTYNPGSGTFTPLNSGTAVVGSLFEFSVHSSRQTEYLKLTASGAPSWLSVNGFTLQGTPTLADVGSSTIQLLATDLYDQTQVANTLIVTVLASGSVVAQEPLSLSSYNSYTGSTVTFTNRAPFLAKSPVAANSFTMRFYYRTEPSFAWPGIASPPAAGSIVPYLRPIEVGGAGAFIGDPTSKTTESLQIVYRPFWPVQDPSDSSKPVPTLPFGATLAEPGFNLPGVRDFKTAHVLYQQSIAADLKVAAYSAVLHDPTRAKYADIATKFPNAIPSGVKTENYLGKFFFPLLPPHLVNRVFIDPNRGTKGSLVLIGQYKKEVFGQSYLLLNVLRGSDLASVMGLCPTGDTDNYPKWTNLVASLTTAVETFHEDLPNKPGNFVPDSLLTTNRGVGELASIEYDNSAADSYALSATGPGSGYITLLEASGNAFTQPGDPVALHVFKVGGNLTTGELKVITAPNPLSEMVTFQHTADLAGRFDEYEYQWKIAAPVDGLPPLADATMSRYLTLTPISTDLNRVIIGGAGIQALSDNYVVMRFRPVNPSHPLYKANPTDADWSSWTAPALAEGWIKRVLAGINPFNQRVNNLFNNQVNTDVSTLTQAGHRWEGDVALNIDSINNYGLIEIYETVLRRGRALSIESGFNYGPANDALLLASGYLNDLYMTVGNESAADAANPTIGIGTANKTYGDIATSLFAFKGQVPSLLEEELTLLRGRDDTLLPGVQVAPVYNRLVWNYTRGIDSGEVVYALNYNIQEDPNRTPDGIINAADAAAMFPQGHGDAYGHYLTALKGYYSLLINPNFDWVPRIEAVNVLGQPVSVDYLDERKFAAAASALANAGRQIFDLTWRKDYQSVHKSGWSAYSATRVNTQRSYNSVGVTKNPVRYWGLDHWATRVGEGSYINWVVGNSILPDVDPIPTHEGIQKIDRTTVPELKNLVTTASGLQTALDNAEGGLSPLGVPEDGMAFDINPNQVTADSNGTHFEQIYQRAKVALNNAVAAFDDAKDVTRLMRSEQDSLSEIRDGIAKQESAYTQALIELYGTPYADDIGVGKTYKQGYEGPDLLHYGYVDLPEQNFIQADPLIKFGSAPTNGVSDLSLNFTNTEWTTIIPSDLGSDILDTDVQSSQFYNVTFNIGPLGYLDKPSTWQGQRRYPGKLQQAISEQLLAATRLQFAITTSAVSDNSDLAIAIARFHADEDTYKEIDGEQAKLTALDNTVASAKFVNDLYDKVSSSIKEDIVATAKSAASSLPANNIVGVASGGDLTSAARGALETAGYTFKKTTEVLDITRFAVQAALELSASITRSQVESNVIGPLSHAQELRAAVLGLRQALSGVQNDLWKVADLVRQYDDKKRAVRALIASGDSIQADRETYRKHAAAIVQGYRTRDAAFRLFRNEKLERYKTLFDLSARYALLAANAYDYETGLLNTSAGRSFISRIISSRALGVVRNGEPQFAGSNTGDPGLSSALAEMKADWDVLRGRLGFNNPDAYGTTVSLRSENFRILPGADGDVAWVDTLRKAQTDNILADPDIRRYCMQVDSGDGLKVPGIVLTFGTTIANGLNFFGQPLAAGDHAFSPSSFATKIFGVGAALEGYQGMANPSANAGTVGTGGGTSPGDPDISFLDQNAMSATPYIYLIPVGADSMRSPPLGDTTTVRTWNVEDLAVPMPFNIGASGFSDKAFYQSSDSLTEPLFGLRKHQAFRPVSSKAFFSQDLYGSAGNLRRTQFTNNRLIGRSVWNSQWKLVIPGRTLLNNPEEGLDRFIRTVKDIKLNFVTYSYSGN
jgi:hypothetical protein